MNRLFCTFIWTLLFITNSYSQVDNTEKGVRVIARNHMIATGELNATADTELPNSILLTVYDVRNGTEIDDPSVQIPSLPTLSYYRIITLGPHTFTHLMFAKSGAYRIINMRKSLPEILSQCFESSEALSLDDNEMFELFNEVLNYYHSNRKK